MGGDGVQDLAQSVARVRRRYDALMLLEAAPPVDAIPVEDVVERIEETGRSHAREFDAGLLAPVIERVECAHRCSADGRERRDERHTAGALRREREVTVVGVIAGRVNTAPECPAAREAVHPRYPVLVDGLAVLRKGEKFVEVGIAYARDGN